MLTFSILTAILSIICITSYEVNKFGVKTIETVPVNMCALMLLLHLLSFFNRLYFIDYIGLLIILLFAVYYLWSFKKTLFGRLKNDFKNVIFQEQNITLVLVGFIIVIGLMRRHVYAYDDFKFWAAEAKSMFFQKGYGAPNTNIASQYFADYPLGSTLIQWWFEHFFKTFHENILYIAQAIFSFSFLVSCTKKVSGKPACGISALFVLSFYTAFTKFGFSLAPDRTMAVIFGAALIMIIDIDRTDNSFYKAGLSLYLAALCLLKSIGFVWVCFAFCFYLYYIKGDLKKRILGGLISLILPASAWLSWFVFCRINNRVAYLTSNATDSLGMSLSAQINQIKEYSFIPKMYIKLLLLGSINCTDSYMYSSGLNLSVAGNIFLLSLIFIWLIKRYPLDKKDIQRKFIATLGICAVFYLFLLWCFLFPFSNEFNGSNNAHMLNLISRYASPALICGWMLLLDDLLCRDDISLASIVNVKRGNYFLVTVLLLLIINIPFSLVSFFGSYWKAPVFETTDEQRSERAQYFASVIKQIEKVEEPCNSRILYCDLNMSIYNYSYLHYFMSPISTINCIYSISRDELTDMAKENACNLLYISDTYKSEGYEWITELTEGFEFNTLYKISFSDNRIVLAKY